ncbi:hypothetical protein DCAR_0309976 [Daucus carota subsp. sativus]|uniref:Uncharacterized protein n=1 Tax=Daucus carota subsp. sativus TaxID=79200 RepID=A0A162AES1_DAUCS|nr:hypothetical protein DCAR_0309976 [Daucus carota subsp. sativus]
MVRKDRWVNQYRLNRVFWLPNLELILNCFVAATASVVIGCNLLLEYLNDQDFHDQGLIIFLLPDV